MLNFVVDRDALAAATPEHPHVDLDSAHRTLHAHTLPDGLPFHIEDDGTFDGCWSLNQYAIDASLTAGIPTARLASDRLPVLRHFTRWLRDQEAGRRADAAGRAKHQWLLDHGEPKLDPAHARRSDLVEFRTQRQGEVRDSTLRTQMGYLSAFFTYALEVGWIDRSPIPMWAGRNTLLPRGRTQRHARFMSPAQTRHFLTAGLRGQGATDADAPTYPERDYVYGLLLATTGLRREEGALVLNNEIPRTEAFPGNGIYPFARTGKKGVTRTIYLTAEVAHEIDFYRSAERTPLVTAAQPHLRRRLRAGDLIRLEPADDLRGQPAVRRHGRVIPTTALRDDERRHAVYVTDEGHVDPAVLLLSRRGFPPALRHWNALFVQARDRVHAGGDPDRPPAHIAVTPHTLRHTFAVRTLALLMSEGRRRTGDPYELLANPVETVKELLGHANLSTTHQYLYAAQTWHEDVPTALTGAALLLLNPDRSRA